MPHPLRPLLCPFSASVSLFLLYSTILLDSIYVCFCSLIAVMSDSLLPQN